MSIVISLDDYRHAVEDNIRKSIAGEDGFFVKAHAVGDVHPNGKWVWTQLPSGKYDWRVIKKQQNGEQSAATPPAIDNDHRDEGDKKIWPHYGHQFDVPSEMPIENQRLSVKGATGKTQSVAFFNSSFDGPTVGLTGDKLDTYYVPYGAWRELVASYAAGRPREITAPYFHDSDKHISLKLKDGGRAFSVTVVDRVKPTLRTHVDTYATKLIESFINAAVKTGVPDQDALKSVRGAAQYAAALFRKMEETLLDINKKYEYAVEHWGKDSQEAKEQREAWDTAVGEWDGINPVLTNPLPVVEALDNKRELMERVAREQDVGKLRACYAAVRGAMALGGKKMTSSPHWKNTGFDDLKVV